MRRGANRSVEDESEVMSSNPAALTDIPQALHARTRPEKTRQRAYAMYEEELAARSPR